MKATIRSLWQEERGVSVVIGAMLMLLVVATMWGTIQAFLVPDWNKDVEYEHLNMVHDDMITFKSDVEDVAISEVPKSSDFRMGVRYPNRMFLVNPGTGVAGSLTSDNVSVSIVYTIVGDPPITQTYNSNRVIYEVQGTIDRPKLVYEHGVIIRDYGNEYATTDEQALIVGDEIYIPVLTGNLTASSSMETESIALKPLSQSFNPTNIESVTITLDTDYPEVWADLLAGTDTDDTTVQVDIDEGEINIVSTAIEQINFPAGDVVTDSLYAGLATFSTVSVPEPASIIGGSTGSNNLDRNNINFVSMYNSDVNNDELQIQQFMPVAGTLSNFYVILDGSPGSGNSYTFIVRNNGEDTLVTCTISGTGTTGSDLTNSVSFEAGDYISIMVTPASRPTARSMRWTAQFSPSQ